ncbi:MAG: peptidyl-prolyl cis-trans isomerase [Deltaproteobacteria bacterium]|nr:peptidyl-prolyl cis-trans isomerase [Deltaproteobacteria bacterium]
MTVYDHLVRHLVLGGSVVAVLTGVVACDEAALRPRSVARVVAVVDGHPLTVGDVAARVASLPESQRPRDRAGLERILTELVDLEVLAAEARRRRFETSPEARGARSAALAEATLSALAGHLPAVDAIPAAEISRYHAEHPELFSSPELRRLSAVAFVDRARAVAARRSPEAADFADLGEVAIRDGAIVRIMPPGTEIPDALARAGLALEVVGAVSPPVEAGGRVWLVRLEGRTASETRPLTREDGNIRRRIAEERFEAARDASIAALRAKTPIDIDEAALALVRATGDLEAYDPARWKQSR